MNVKKGSGRLSLLPLVALAAPVAVVLAGASPAQAASGTITNPPNETVYTSNNAIQITARLSRGALDSGRVDMTLTPPGEAGKVVDSASGSDVDMSYTFSPACPNYGSGCAGRPASNGVYTVTLSGANASATSRFTLRVPAAAPANATATVTDVREVTVSWTVGNEPDLDSYEVYERVGDSYTTIARGLPASTSAYTISLGSSGYGGDHTYAVRARRRACPGCSETLESPMSLTNTLHFDEPGSTPNPQPTPSESGSADPGDGGYNGDPGPGDGGDGGSGDGGSGNNGGNNGNGNGGGKKPGASPSPTTDENGYNVGSGNNGEFSSGGSKTKSATLTSRRIAFGLNFKDFAPKIGAPKLPPLPKTAPVPTPEGTFDPTLDYGDQTVAVPPTTKAGGVRQVLDSFVTQVMDTGRLLRSIATALVLLLAAAHLRVWLKAGPREY